MTPDPELAHHKGGWLTNPERRSRRDTENTFTDEYAQKLIDKIEKIENYTRSSDDAFIKMRDQALIATGITFFKRGGEILAIRLCDISVDQGKGMLSITFNIQKKVKRRKLCQCGAKNAKKAVFCWKCGGSLSNATIIEQGEPAARYSKQKTLKYPFCKYILNWIKIAQAQGAKSSSFIFPPFRAVSGGFDFTRSITIQRLDQILQNLDPTLTSSMFRYGKTESLLKHYSIQVVKKMGNWSNIAVPMRYAERKGLTEEDRKFAEDMG